MSCGRKMLARTNVHLINQHPRKKGSNSELQNRFEPEEMISPSPRPPNEALYCPKCAREVPDPLTCGDCSAVICRVCGTPLESSSDLGMG